MLALSACASTQATNRAVPSACDGVKIMTPKNATIDYIYKHDEKFGDQVLANNEFIDKACK